VTEYAPKRFEEPDRDSLPPAQQAAYDRLFEVYGDRLPGPYRIWLHYPDFAEAMEHVGKYFREKSIVPRRLREIAIIMAARSIKAEYAWQSHRRSAAKEGISEAAIDAIREGREATFEKEDEAAVYAYCKQMLENNRADDATWDRINAALGDRGVMELTAVTGYYGLVGIFLNAYRFPPTGEGPRELEE